MRVLVASLLFVLGTVVAFSVTPCLWRRHAHFDAYSSQHHHHVRLFVSSTNQKETKQDVYQTLGVSWNANMDEIKTAYRTLAKKWHPGELKN
jgi:DnaJ-domain-containing protein 1